MNQLIVKKDRALATRLLNQDSYAWEDFVDRFVSPFLMVIDEVVLQQGESLDSSQREAFLEAVFRALRYNNFQILREFEGNSTLLTYLMIVVRRLTIALLNDRHSNNQ